VQHKKAKLVKLILFHPAVDPSPHDNCAVTKKCNVVKSLLYDPSVDPAAQDSEALDCACQKLSRHDGHVAFI
jgi:hypothetical protein